MNFKFTLPKFAPRQNTNLSIPKLRQKMIGNVGDLTVAEINSIVDSINQFDSVKYLEIGVNYGATFLYLLNNCNLQKAVGVDLFEELEKYLIKEEDNTHNMWINHNGEKMINTATTEELYRLVDRKKVEFYACDSNIMLDLVKEKFNVIFIDGNHTYNQTKIDFENSYKLSDDKCVFIFHNATNHLSPDKAYVEKDGGPWKVCQELKERNDLEFVGYFDRCAIFNRIS